VTLLVVAGALQNDAGAWLVQKRPAGKPYAGLWEFPGGKVDNGETPTAALVRELHEELGLMIAEQDCMPWTFSVGTLYGPGESITLLLFKVRYWCGVPKPIHAAELAWVDYQALKALPMPRLDLPFLDIIEQVSPIP
jgi:8-oxo-dGTP diphosphatase